MAQICGLANPGVDSNVVLEVTPEELETIRRALRTAMERATLVSATADQKDIGQLLDDLTD